MRRWLALPLLLIAASAAAQDRINVWSGKGHGDRRFAYADPSDVLAAEIAFARLARDKGQWTAFRQTAAPDAQMFAPQTVRAAAWLKGRADPKVAVAWQPDAVWMSCDGSYAVTRGPWQRPDSVGWFVTVWQRQEKGAYKWVLDQGDTLDKPLPESEMISAKLAACPERKPEDSEDLRRKAAPQPRRDPNAPPPEFLASHSDDRTLDWTTVIDAKGNRAFTLRLRGEDGAMHEVLKQATNPPPVS